jgi:hypothetical protein
MSVRRACHARAPSSGVVGTLHGPAIDLKPRHQTTTGTLTEGVANLSVKEARTDEQTPHATTPEWLPDAEGMERARAHVAKVEMEAEQRLAHAFNKLGSWSLGSVGARLDEDEVYAYDRARGRFESILGLYTKNKTSLYPLEARYINTFVHSFPMREDERRIMENRWTEIQSVLGGTSRPRRTMEDNREYVNLLTGYIAHINDIFKFQRR